MKQSYDEEGLLKEHFRNRRPYTLYRHSKDVGRIRQGENIEKVGTEFLIADSLDRCVDKRNERYKS